MSERFVETWKREADASLRRSAERRAAAARERFVRRIVAAAIFLAVIAIFTALVVFYPR